MPNWRIPIIHLYIYYTLELVNEFSETALGHEGLKQNDLKTRYNLYAHA